MLGLRICPSPKYRATAAHPQARARASVQITCPDTSLPAIVAAHPSVVKGGGVTLECDDGGLPVLRDVFALSSPLMADLLGEGSTSVNVSGTTKEEWLLVISQLYPIVPHPELSLQQLQQVLPVVHKYNFPELLQYVSSRLVTELPRWWSLDPSASGYILKWLLTAEQLQLDTLKQAALEGLKKQPGQPGRFKWQIATKVLHADLLCLSPELMLEAWRVVAEAEMCSACTGDCTCERKHSGGTVCSKCSARVRCSRYYQCFWRSDPEPGVSG
ncbi:hypothetical protein V8C86DRAFT_1314910 [Haematococcus lacustris]